jgi:hypothetical protein
MANNTIEEILKDLQSAIEKKEHNNDDLATLLEMEEICSDRLRDIQEEVGL